MQHKYWTGCQLFDNNSLYELSEHFMYNATTSAYSLYCLPRITVYHVSWDWNWNWNRNWNCIHCDCNLMQFIVQSICAIK